MKFVTLHPLSYEEKPRGHQPDHFKAIEDELEVRGHTMLLEGGYIGDADVLLFDSDVWNLQPRGTSPYGWRVLDTVLRKHIPVVWFDNFDHYGTDTVQAGWIGKDDWREALAFTQEGAGLHHFAEFAWALSRCHNPLLYFMRKMQIHQDYPDWVQPLELPMMEDWPLVESPAELAVRPFDVCGLANMSFPRSRSMLGLYRDGRLKVDCDIVEHYQRLEYPEWVDRHRNAKFFLEADASMGSERSLRLMTVAPMLRVKSDHRLPFPRQDMVHMVEIGGYDGSISKADVDKVLSVINDKDLLWSIYSNGAQHLRKYYSLSARTSYAVDLIERFVK